MKRLVSILTMSLFAVLLNAQNISVVGIKLDENDHTAEEDATMKFDQNGEVCALIKILTDESDFSYDVGSLGVTDVEEHEGEIWLYVPFGIKKVILRHQELGSCEYAIPIAIESGKTYRMALSVNGVAKEINDQELEIACSPERLSLFIDDVEVPLKEGYAKIRLPLGVHAYSAEHSNYTPQSGTVELKASSPSRLVITLSKITTNTSGMSYMEWLTQEPVEYIVPGTEVKFTMIAVPPKRYVQGATFEQVNPWEDEMPTHDANVDGFFIGQTEVTQELWQAVMGTNPSRFRGEEFPVEQVSWNDCQLFISRLNAIMGQKFRLPTEAEWELAARGGSSDAASQYSGSQKIDEVAWYVGNSLATTHTVATRKPNKLGIYDLSGNVQEWCQDWYYKYTTAPQDNPKGPQNGTHHVVRGGSWMSDGWGCRTTCRDINTPEASNAYIGLRLAM